MRRRKKIHAWPVMASRWRAWAAQLAARRGRLADATEMPLPLHAKLGRTLLLLHERWLSFHSQSQPKIVLSINACGVWNAGPTNVYAPQMKFLQSLAAHAQRSLKPEAGRTPQRAAQLSPQLESRRAMPVTFAHENARRVAMTLAAHQDRASFGEPSTQFFNSPGNRVDGSVAQANQATAKGAGGINDSSAYGVA